MRRLDFSEEDSLRWSRRNGAGYDFAYYRDAPARPADLVRRHGGSPPTLRLLTQWIDWAFAETKAALPKAA